MSALIKKTGGMGFSGSKWKNKTGGMGTHMIEKEKKEPVARSFAPPPPPPAPAEPLAQASEPAPVEEKQKAAVDPNAEKQIRDKKEKKRKVASNQSGRRPTMLTGGQGVLKKATVLKKTLGGS